jgi:xanthine dehydrogenase accessory factor
MHAVNHEVIESLVEWLSSDEGCWLGTVVSTWGASPRPAGSVFAFNAMRNKVVGSLSSGCIEEVLLAELRRIGGADRPFLRVYGQDASEQTAIELPCGGSLEVLLEWHSPKSHTHFEELLSGLKQRRLVCRRYDLQTGGLSLVENVCSEVMVELSDTELLHTLGPVERLLILGLGEPARYLTPIAETLEFEVSLCDPRKDVVARTAIPKGVTLYTDILPDDLIRRQFSDRRCAIVALAHDPRVDDLGLLAALETEAFYVGALGSLKTSKNRFERLKSLGLNANMLKALHAPIGLDIDSKTPPEIAVSIAAQLVSARAERKR